MLAFSNDYYGFIFRATQSVELFCAYNKKINVMYPAINYPRPIDQRNLKTIVSKLNQYKGFSNVSIIPMEGQSNRFFDFNLYPQLFDTVCKYLSLSKIEKECLLDRSNAEFAYLAFMDRVDGRFCDYIRGVLNIAIEYADM